MTLREDVYRGIINKGVNAVRNLGYKDCTRDNLLIDPIYKKEIKKILLKSQETMHGVNPVLDEVTKSILEKIGD